MNLKEAEQLYDKLLNSCGNNDFRAVGSFWKIATKWSSLITIMNIALLVFATSKAGNPAINRLLEDTAVKFSGKRSIN